MSNIIDQDPSRNPGTEAAQYTFPDLAGRGRLDAAGHCPTPEQWLDQHALPQDLVFDNDTEVASYFGEQTRQIDETVATSQATRETIISQLFSLSDSMGDVVENVIFDQLPMRRGSTDTAGYIPPSLSKGAYLKGIVLPTFKAQIHLFDKQKYPKQIPNHIVIEDQVIPGLDVPHSISIKFGSTALAPWMVGISTPQSVISVSLGGKDNAAKPVEFNGLYKSADPEAIQQTLDLCQEITTALFRTDNLAAAA